MHLGFVVRIIKHSSNVFMWSLPVTRHTASFLSVFKLLLIGVIILGKDPFALFGMEAPGLWVWSQENKARLFSFIDLELQGSCSTTGTSTGAFWIKATTNCINVNVCDTT